jgi:hypothetical protein
MKLEQIEEEQDSIVDKDEISRKNSPSPMKLTEKQFSNPFVNKQ